MECLFVEKRGVKVENDVSIKEDKNEQDVLREEDIEMLIQQGSDNPKTNQNREIIESEEDGFKENEDNQYVIFRIDGQDFGIEIEHVHEINRLKEVVINPVPKTFEYVEGIINLRGEVVPVLDLRKKLGFPAEKMGRETRILIVRIDNKTIGLIVDMVLSVVNINEMDITSTPDEIKDKNTRFFSGIAQLDKRMTFLLSINEVLNSEEE